MPMTNRKLLEEIIAQSESSNQSIREQLQNHISTTSEASRGVMNSMFERYTSDYTALTALIDKSSDEITRKVEDQRTVTDELKRSIDAYNSKLDEVKNGLIEKMDTQFSQMLQIHKALSAQMADLQKDSAIIMETMQIILTNMLIDEVRKE